MDPRELDDLSRAFQDTHSRSGFLKGVVGFSLGVLAMIGSGSLAEAKKHKSKKEDKSKKGDAGAEYLKPGAQVTPYGNATCGLSYTACSEARLTGNGYTRTTTPWGVNGSYTFGTVPHSKWYTLRVKFFSVAYRRSMCKNYSVWVGNPSTGTRYYIGSTMTGNTAGGLFSC